LKSVNTIPVICISSTQKPKIKDYRKLGINLKAIQMDGVSHFLMMSHPVTFNYLLNEQLNKISRSNSNSKVKNY